MKMKLGMLGALVAAAACGAEVEEGFAPLFNGRDLAGWIGNASTYYVSEPGVLACGPRAGTTVRPDDYLMTEKEYADFVIRFDFKYEPGGDNGLGIRWPGASDMAYTGVEMQLADTVTDKPRQDLWRTAGGYYGVSNALDDRKPGQPRIGATYWKGPGEWNQVELRAEGSRVTAWLNGVKVNDCDLAARNPDTGFDNGHPHPGVRAKKGHVVWWVGNARRTVWWRNIRIKTLNDAAQIDPDCRRFLYSDFMNRKLVYVDEANPAAYWEAFLPEIAFDVTRSGHNHFVAAQRQGWRLYDLGQLQFVREVKDAAHLKFATSATRLPDGRTFVLDARGVVEEYDAADKWVFEYRFPKEVAHCRVMRLTDRGTAVIGAYTGFAEVALDRARTPEKRLVKWFPMPAGTRYSFQGQYRADGTLLASGGYLPELVAFSPDGKILSRAKAGQKDGLADFFYGGFAVRPNGNVIVANWTGHSGRDFKPGWKLIEFDPAGRVAWKWNAPWAGTPCALLNFD